MNSASGRNQLRESNVISYAGTSKIKLKGLKVQKGRNIIRKTDRQMDGWMDGWTIMILFCGVDNIV